MGLEIWDFGAIRRGLELTRLSGTSLGLTRNDCMVGMLKGLKGGILLGWLNFVNEGAYSTE